MTALDVIDLFAGAGGSSEGARQAGARVLWAANHWPLAVQVHARNHPETVHECQDLHQCNWSRVPVCDLVLASPSCKTHSQCSQPRRMDKLRYDADRNTPLAVVACLEEVRPRAAVIENVVQLRRWPLFPEWCSMLRKLGYHLTEHVVDASRLGVPQERERLFITASIDGPLVLRLPELPRVPARSIRVSTERGWELVRDCFGPKAVARIERSAERHGPEFVTHYVSDDVGHSLDEPLKTITTKHQWAWVRRGRRGLERRPFSALEYARAMGFPDEYVLTGQVSKDCELVGNAVPPPVMRAIVASVAEQWEGRLAA